MEWKTLKNTVIDVNYELNCYCCICYLSSLIIFVFVYEGIHEVVHMALRRIDPHSEKSIHVSFDIDSLDPLEAPSTGTPGEFSDYL